MNKPKRPKFHLPTTKDIRNLTNQGKDWLIIDTFQDLRAYLEHLCNCDIMSNVDNVIFNKKK